jgi:hypothetical protein
MEKYNEAEKQWEAVTVRDVMKVKGIKKALKIMEEDNKMAIKSIFNGQKQKLLERLHLAENHFFWMNEERNYLAFAYLADVKNDWRNSLESLKIGGEFENETYNFSAEVSEDIKRWGEKGHSLVCYEDSEINEILETLKNDNFQEESQKTVLYMKNEIGSFVIKYLIAPLSRIQKETDQKLRIIMFFDN